MKKTMISTLFVFVVALMMAACEKSQVNGDAQKGTDSEKVFKPSTEETIKESPKTISYVWPIQNIIYSSREVFAGGQDAGFISSRFGGDQQHPGIDLAFKDGVPVYAAAKGLISFVGCDSRCNSCDSCDKGYGKYVIIFHPDGNETRYAHLQDFKVVQGDKVNQGDLIGHVGHSGSGCRSLVPGGTGSHLHFEIRKYSNPVDPMLYLPLLESKLSDEEEEIEKLMEKMIEKLEKKINENKAPEEHKE